jgi:hypothetical protein
MDCRVKPGNDPLGYRSAFSAGRAELPRNAGRSVSGDLE